MSSHIPLDQTIPKAPSKHTPLSWILLFAFWFLPFVGINAWETAIPAPELPPKAHGSSLWSLAELSLNVTKYGSYSAQKLWMIFWWIKWRNPSTPVLQTASNNTRCFAKTIFAESSNNSKSSKNP